MWFSCVNSSTLAGHLSPPRQPSVIYGLFGDSWATECTQFLTHTANRERERDRGKERLEVKGGKIAWVWIIPHTTHESKKRKQKDFTGRKGEVTGRRRRMRRARGDECREEQRNRLDGGLDKRKTQ